MNIKSNKGLPNLPSTWVFRFVNLAIYFAQSLESGDNMTNVPQNVPQDKDKIQKVLSEQFNKYRYIVWESMRKLFYSEKTETACFRILSKKIRM